MRIFSDANFDFLALRNRTYVVSAIALAIGVAAMLYFQVAAGSWINYGVDFTGGTIAQVEFQEETSAAQVRAAFGDLGGDAAISQYGSDREYIVRLPT